MDWHYESTGVWVAKSRLTADGALLFWRVQIEKTGLFTAGNSDSELGPGGRLFVTHSEATQYCEMQELKIFQSYGG